MLFFVTVQPFGARNRCSNEKPDFFKKPASILLRDGSKTTSAFGVHFVLVLVVVLVHIEDDDENEQEETPKLFLSHSYVLSAILPDCRLRWRVASRTLPVHRPT